MCRLSSLKLGQDNASLLNRPRDLRVKMEPVAQEKASGALFRGWARASEGRLKVR